MPDREKTIELLKEIADYFEKCRHNASFGSKAEEHFWELRSAARDAEELLKGYEYARCRNCQFRDFGENEIDSWDRCKLHRHNTSPDEYCSWFVERAGEVV